MIVQRYEKSLDWANFWADFFSLYAGNLKRGNPLPAKVTKRGSRVTKQSPLLPLLRPHGRPSATPGHCHATGFMPTATACHFSSLTIFVLKFCNFVSDVGETIGKYRKQRYFGRFLLFTKLRYKLDTKISFCKQKRVCKHQFLTGFCR